MKRKKNREGKRSFPPRNVSRHEPGCPRLSLCMIVKNEAENLEPCLRSIQPVLDEIILVDTGSTDGTREIARRMGAKVFDFPWRDDFSAARNESIRHATGDYILWLDADDRIDEPEMRKIGLLKKELSPSKNRAFYVVVSSEAPEGETLFQQLRIFPNVKGARFEGRIHEQIFYGLQKAGVGFVKTEIVIRHVGYHDAASRQAKAARNLEILDRELQKEPGSLHLRYNKARTLLGQGRQLETLPLLKAIIEEERVVREEKGILLEAGLLMGKCLMDLGRFDEAVSLFRGLSGDFHRSGLLHFCLGEALFFTRNFRDGLEELEKSRSLPLEAGLFPVNLDRLDYFRHYRLGQCYLELGKVDRAKEVLLQSISLQPDHGRSLESLGLLSLSTGQFEEAVSYYERAVKKGAASDQTLTNLGLAYAKLGREGEGERALRKALEINPQKVEALTNLGHLLHKKKAFSEAGEFFQRALLLNPSLPDARLALSEISYGRYDIDSLVAQCEALGKESGLSFQGTLNGFEDLAVLYVRIGEEFVRRDRNELALRTFHVAFLLHPSEVILKKTLTLAACLGVLDASADKVKEAMIFQRDRNHFKQEDCPGRPGTHAAGWRFRSSDLRLDRMAIPTGFKFPLSSDDK